MSQRWLLHLLQFFLWLQLCLRMDGEYMFHGRLESSVDIRLDLLEMTRKA